MYEPVMYIGNGNYLDGLPARDMTLAEWELIDEATRSRALALKLYQIGNVKRSVSWDEKRPTKRQKDQNG